MASSQPNEPRNRLLPTCSNPRLGVLGNDLLKRLAQALQDNEATAPRLWLQERAVLKLLCQIPLSPADLQQVRVVKWQIHVGEYGQSLSAPDRLSIENTLEAAIIDCQHLRYPRGSIRRAYSILGTVLANCLVRILNAHVTPTRHGTTGSRVVLRKLFFQDPLDANETRLANDLLDLMVKRQFCPDFTTTMRLSATRSFQTAIVDCQPIAAGWICANTRIGEEGCNIVKSKIAEVDRRLQNPVTATALQWDEDKCKFRALCKLLLSMALSPPERDCLQTMSWSLAHEAVAQKDASDEVAAQMLATDIRRAIADSPRR